MGHRLRGIDSDLPPVGTGDAPVLDEAEVMRRRHDEVESGRLLRTKAWTRARFAPAWARG